MEVATADMVGLSRVVTRLVDFLLCYVASNSTRTAKFIHSCLLACTCAVSATACSHFDPAVACVRALLHVLEVAH